MGTDIVLAGYMNKQADIKDTIREYAGEALDYAQENPEIAGGALGALGAGTGTALSGGGAGNTLINTLLGGAGGAAAGYGYRQHQDLEQSQDKIEALKDKLQASKKENVLQQAENTMTGPTMGYVNRDQIKELQNQLDTTESQRSEAVDRFQEVSGERDKVKDAYQQLRKVVSEGNKDTYEAFPEEDKGSDFWENTAEQMRKARKERERRQKAENMTTEEVLKLLQNQDNQ